MVPVFVATVEQNKLKVDDSLAFSLWLGQFVGKRVEVIVRKKRRARTTGKHNELGNQNGWYWSVILPISAKELGYTVDEMHEVFIQMFAPYTIKQFGDKKLEIKIRTSEMDTVQFTEYVETIRAKMAEMNVLIPDPDKTM